eukprot:14542080-Alexandrium_andersonii.AAC.1
MTTPLACRRGDALSGSSQQSPSLGTDRSCAWPPTALWSRPLRGRGIGIVHFGGGGHPARRAH